MKFTITREKLHEGLGAVASSVPTKTTLPVLANVLVEAVKDGLRLSATDLDIAVSTTIAASVDQEGSMTLPARKLVEIVKELPSAAIRVTGSGEQRAQIECGKSKFKLLGLSRDEFPAFPTVKFDGRWDRRPDRMRMVATNGPRLARMDVPTTSQSGGQADLVIPPKALEQIRRLFGGDEEIEIGKSDNHLGFRSASTQIFTRLIEGPYPNYEQVIPRENDKNLTADRSGLAAALRRMSIVASDQTHRIRMAFTNGACKLSVQTPDLGEAQEEISVAYEGDPLEIGFNAAYLLEILKFMPTDEVRMTFKAPERAATCEPVGWDDPASYMTLVMPLRLVD